MSTFTDISAVVTVATVYSGYAPKGAEHPYIVHRPLLVNPDAVAINGDATDWDHQSSMYCCASSSEAAYNLGLAVMNQLQGARVSGTTLSVSMGYAGSPIEGHYETQLTIQLNQGGI